jgi:hypothetical protein
MFDTTNVPILVDTTSLPQYPKDVISATLDTTQYNSHYSITNVWVLDTTTMLPVGMNQAITLGSPGNY